ncbi:hypothetical protein P154DRAFT_621693 [Amniculicola lignicola CBS 123094]|uniref:Uncharacterized protein n=1 Tax=Amniculicola lignicola CBS 123094 TaxID=1392246 RepID=A0A6A5W9J4_9PLEO|nr:hypothetical protein P154DRAFT_621693 [Amniculicola lignicola CBS 123094]
MSQPSPSTPPEGSLSPIVASPSAATPSGTTAVMSCATKQDDFKTVTIHTAKCSHCDNRNKATMLRCPGCTWQICEVCRKVFEGRPLMHGQMAASPANLPATPARRVLFTPVGSGATGTPVPFNLPVVTPTPSAASMTAVNAASGSSKSVRASKGKAKAKAFEPLSDDEYNPGPGSPTPAKKRKGPASTTTPRANEKRRPATAGSSLAAPPITQDAPVSAGLDASTPAVSRALYVPERDTTLTTRQMIDQVLLELGGSGYSEGHHLYGPLPPWDQIKPGAQQQNGQAQAQAQVQSSSQTQKPLSAADKLKKLDAATDSFSTDDEALASDSAPESSQMPVGAAKQTVRDLVRLQAQKSATSANIGQDQLDDMVGGLTSTCRALLVRFYKGLSAKSKEHTRFHIDMPFGDLDEPYKLQILETIQREAGKLLEQFADEAEMAKMVVGTPKKLPEKGLFHVTPSPVKGRLGVKETAKGALPTESKRGSSKLPGGDDDDVFL